VTPVSIAQIRLCKYLNNIIDQDHLAIKRISRAIRGFKLFLGACITIAGIETVHMTRKGKRYCLDGKTMPAVNQFYNLQRDPQRCHALLLADTAIATEPKNLMKHCWRICRFLKLM